MARMALPGALLLLLLVGAGAARADRADDEAAKQHFDRGTTAYALGRYSEAATEFEQAYESKPDAALLFNAAQAHRAAGNQARALELFQNYLRVYSGRVGNEAEVQHIVAQLKEAIASRSKASAARSVTPPPALSPSPGSAGAPEVAPPLGSSPSPAPVQSPNVLVAGTPPRPLYRRAWFWGAVGGGAAVVAVAIALGVVYGSSTRNPTPSIGTWAY